MPCSVLGLLERTQTEKWSLEQTQSSLERTQTEKWSLEQTLVRSSALIQRVVRSSECFRTSLRSSREWVARANTKFARANASKNQSGFLQLSLFSIPFSIHFHNHLQSILDLMSTTHSSFNPYINDISNLFINP